MLLWEGMPVSSENVQIVCSSSVLSENGSVIALTGRKRVYGSITIISECCVPWLGVEATPEVDTLPHTPNYVHLVHQTASGGVPTSEAGAKFSHSSFTRFHM